MLGAAGRQVVVPSSAPVAAMVEKTLLILAQAVVVLVVGRGKGCAHGVELRVGGTAVAGQFRRAVLADWAADCDQPVISSSVLPSGVRRVMCAPGVEPLKYFADIDLRLNRRLGWRQIAVHRGHNSR